MIRALDDPRSSSRAMSSQLNISSMFVEEFFGLVDLGGQVRAAATIGVVEEHELTVLLAHLVLVQFALTVGEYHVSNLQQARRGSIRVT